MYLIALVINVLIVFSRSSAEKGYFWHVTDFHYDPTYWTSQLSCNENVPDPGPFGDYWCDSPWRLVKDTVENMATIKADIDFVIWTGDTVAHISDDNLTLAKNMEILENITRLLQQTFSNSVSFYPTLGNHDFYPSDQADVVQDAMYNETRDIWRRWINSEDELQQFVLGGFYHKEVQPKLRLLALNTNLYYTPNKITKGMPDPAGQFKWMEAVLAKARTNGEKVIVTAHIPPGIKTPDFVDWMYVDHHEKLINILTNYSDIIIASHYGHDHSDGFKIIEDSMNASKVIPQYIAPSVTPWRFKIPNKTGLPHNPGIRLVEYERETGQHLNYIQYYINLTDTNTNGKSLWEPLYNFCESYGVNDMSVESLRDIFKRMEKDSGMALAQKYCNHALVSKYAQYCPAKYRWRIVCGGRIHDIDKAEACVTEKLVGNGVMLGAYLSIYFFIFGVILLA